MDGALLQGNPWKPSLAACPLCDSGHGPPLSWPQIPNLRLCEPFATLAFQLNYILHEGFRRLAASMWGEHGRPASYHIFWPSPVRCLSYNPWTWTRLDVIPLVLSSGVVSVSPLLSLPTYGTHLCLLVLTWLLTELRIWGTNIPPSCLC